MHRKSGDMRAWVCLTCPTAATLMVVVIADGGGGGGGGTRCLVRHRGDKALIKSYTFIGYSGLGLWATGSHGQGRKSSGITRRR